MRKNAKASDKITASPAERGDHTDHARSNFFEPASGECSGEAEEHNRN